MIRVDQPEPAVLKILRAVHSTAIELQRAEEKGEDVFTAERGFVQWPVCAHQLSMNIDLKIKDISVNCSSLTCNSQHTYCGHDGIPCGGEDICVVVALIVSFQLFGEIFPGQLHKNPAQADISITVRNYPKTQQISSSQEPSGAVLLVFSIWYRQVP